MKNFYWAIIILALGPLNRAVCSPLFNFPSEQQAYLERAKSFPFEFIIPKSEADDAWGRAQSFIGRFSSTKLLTVTDFVIQTFDPMDCSDEYGYSVIKTPMGDHVLIAVGCMVGNTILWPKANKNAHILAYYIKTGEFPYPELIAR